MHPLDGPRLRLHVVNSKAAYLRTAIGARLDRIEFTSLPVQYHAKTRKNTVVLRFPPLTDPTWSLVVGEICHNLRAALDGLVYQLALLHNPVARVDADTSCAFPICRHKRDRHDGGRTMLGFDTGSVKKLRLLNPKHRALFEKYQPYMRGNRGDLSPLWCLHELNNTDKHKIVHVVSVHSHKSAVTLYDKATGRVLTSGTMGHGRLRNLEGSTEITLPFRGPKAENVGVTMNHAIDVCFDRGSGVLTRKGVVASIAYMQKAVNQVVRHFEPEFIGGLAGWSYPPV